MLNPMHNQNFKILLETGKRGHWDIRAFYSIYLIIKKRIYVAAPAPFNSLKIMIFHQIRKQNQNQRRLKSEKRKPTLPKEGAGPCKSEKRHA